MGRFALKYFRKLKSYSVFQQNITFKGTLCLSNWNKTSETKESYVSSYIKTNDACNMTNGIGKMAKSAGGGSK